MAQKTNQQLSQWGARSRLLGISAEQCQAILDEDPSVTAPEQYDWFFVGYDYPTPEERARFRAEPAAIFGA